MCFEFWLNLTVTAWESLPTRGPQWGKPRRTGNHTGLVAPPLIVRNTSKVEKAGTASGVVVGQTGLEFSLGGTPPLTNSNSATYKPSAWSSNSRALRRWKNNDPLFPLLRSRYNLHYKPFTVLFDQLADEGLFIHPTKLASHRNCRFIAINFILFTCNLLSCRKYHLFIEV